MTKMMTIDKLERMLHCLRVLKKAMIDAKSAVVYKDGQKITPDEIQEIIDYFHIEEKPQIRRIEK